MMVSSLFDLISFAGSMSLEELQARTSESPDTLGHELAALLRGGRISVADPTELVSGPLAVSIKLGSRNREGSDALEKALIEALANPKLSSEIALSPTTQGYRYAIS